MKGSPSMPNTSLSVCGKGSTELADEVMCDLFARADHIAYGVYLESDVTPV